MVGTRGAERSGDSSDPKDWEAFARLYRAVDGLPCVSIAVCVGHCVGAGAEIVAACDLRVGADNLRLAWPGGRLGVPMGPARLVPLVGLSVAKDLILTGGWSGWRRRCPWAWCTVRQPRRTPSRWRSTWPARSPRIRLMACGG